MIFEQTVVIPESHRLHLDLELPNALPSGAACLKLIPLPPETMLLAESALAKTWNTSEEDAAWKDL